MTTMTRPLDAAVAHSLNEITGWAAEELAARLRARSLDARTGYSNASCSTYVDVRIDDDNNLCIRFSDHDAMSYNRTGDYNIAFGNRYGDAHAHVALTALYVGERYIVEEFDEDGEPLSWTAEHYLTADDGAAEDGCWTAFDLAGYRADGADLIAAVAAAEAFVTARD